MNSLSGTLTDLWIATKGNFARIRSFRRCIHAGLEIVAAEAYSAGLSLPRDLDADGWYFPDRDHALSDGFAQQVASALAESKTLNDTASMNAASLVFAHSILDNIATECCRISTLAAPDDWKSAIDRKEVSLADVRALSFSELYKSKLKRYFEKEISNKSLLDRIDLINQKCQPVPSYKHEGAIFNPDSQRLREFDRARHKIIHDLSQETARQDMDDELVFVERTSEYLMWCINKRYKIPMDIADWQARMRERNRA